MMPTPSTSSLTLTNPSPLQSPVHGATQLSVQPLIVPGKHAHGIGEGEMLVTMTGGCGLPASSM
jgi:hypothetical protein